jgi:hypothetical protein
MTRLRLLACFLVGLVTESVLATDQEPDLLIFEGQRIYTHSLPALSKAFPDITFPEFSMISTANYSGYRATWATFQKQLYLVGLEARVDGKTELSHNGELLPAHAFPLKVQRWSGTIAQTAKSSSLNPKTMIWTDITETTTITVKNGIVTGAKVDMKQVPRKPSQLPRPKTSPAKKRREPAKS